MKVNELDENNKMKDSKNPIYSQSSFEV